MPVNPARAKLFLHNADLKSLFIEELGWDDHRSRPFDVTISGQTYTLEAIAEKRGLVVFVCGSNSSVGLPSPSLRKNIGRHTTAHAHEHIIVFTDQARTMFKWQWVKHDLGKTVYREHTFYRHQTGEALAQKLTHLGVEFEEEEKLTVSHVVGKARRAFDVERVTKQFYEKFRKEHQALIGLISGISSTDEREWYASIMLNRLMFVYFIQKKGFLDGDRAYLRNRLRMMQDRKGKDSFLSFYRHFLLRLFHNGLGQRPSERATDLDALIGNVPYLNGGLFDVHELEKSNPEIQIPDEAFELLFDFFDLYDWHLDDSPLRNDREINPDVLGYIFEKYINQKQMGAYYTREDITGFIARNTVVCYLLQAVAEECPAYFGQGGRVWRLLADDPDRYIHSTLQTGVGLPLPDAIAVGLDDVRARSKWDQLADSEYGLPTETWREHVQRRQRYQRLREALTSGTACSVNDLTRLNLDVNRLAVDAIENCDEPRVLTTVYTVLRQVSVLDPTCGSGAFLFAALNVLEPLYDACLHRMEAFVEGSAPIAPGVELFREVLAQLRSHYSPRYYILKSIIISNLYGVDLMPEAVEICKLRLFLKLAAQVDRVEHLEPLPDIDFNIRQGNALVGFPRLESVAAALSGDGRQAQFDLEGSVEHIVTRSRLAASEFEGFQDLQQDCDSTSKAIAEAKKSVLDQLSGLRSQLDQYLAHQYGARSPGAAARWKASHSPFHWFVEFFTIMEKGGFDVIIGNPPWIEYSNVKRTYTVRGYETEKCGNLHGMCTERGLSLLNPKGRMSYIVQLPLTNSGRMDPVRKILEQSSSFLAVATFADRPGKLFEGLENCRSVIFMLAGRGSSDSSHGKGLYVTRYHRWATEARGLLFDLMEFAEVRSSLILRGHFPKYPNDVAVSLFGKVKQYGVPLATIIRKNVTRNFVFYLEATQYWVKATVGLPYFSKNGIEQPPGHGRFIYLDNDDTAFAVAALLGSSLFFAFFIAYGDCFHLSDTLVTNFPIAPGMHTDAELSALGRQLMDSLVASAQRKTIRTKDGDVISYDEFYGAKTKAIRDAIDLVMARYYRFTEEEVEFVKSFDCKHRVGDNISTEG